MPLILCLIGDGRSIHTLRWAEHFARKGHTVHLVTYDQTGYIIKNVTEHVINSRWKNQYLAFFPRHISIRKLVKKIKPDIIHAHFIAKYGFPLPDLPFRPRVVSAWGDDVLILPKKNPLIRWYTKRVLDTVDLIYAVSTDISNHIMEDFAIHPKKVKVLPFGIDTDVFSPQADSEGKSHHDTIEVFSNRGYFPVYDTETLVKGFSLARKEEPRLRLTLKGDGPEEQKIRNLVAALGISDIVTFSKRTPFDRVPQDYHRADIFVTTSLSDGTPVSVLEAMASAVPCIATAVGGIPEWIEDKVTGLLVSPRSPHQVSERLLMLAKDPGLRSRLGNSARATVMKRGQWTELMAQAEKDYLALIEIYKQDKR